MPIFQFKRKKEEEDELAIYVGFDVLSSFSKHFIAYGKFYLEVRRLSRK